MQIEFRFSRDNTTLGTDVAPVDETYLTNDNVFHAPRYGPASEPKTGLVFAYQYDGAGTPPTVDVVAYFYDSQDQVWYQFAVLDVQEGEAEYIPFPTTVDRSEDRQLQKTYVAFVVEPVGAVPAGDYYFASSSVVGGAGDADIELLVEATHLEDTEHVSGDRGVLGLAVRNDTLGSLVNADGDYAPVQVNADGAVYVTADPTAPVAVEGMAADDDAVAGNPVQVGGLYLADEAANPIEDGDIGYLVSNLLRQLRTDLATKLAGEDLFLDVVNAIENGSAVALAAAGTQTIKVGTGILIRLIYLNVSAAASTCVVYDNVAAAGVQIVPTHSMTTTEIPGNAPHSVKIGARFTVGCTIVTTGTTDVIAVYR